MLRLTLAFFLCFTHTCEACWSRRSPPTSVTCSNPTLPTFTKDPPFAHLPLPECQDKIKVKFTFRTTTGDTEIDPEDLPGGISNLKRTVFIAHGFTESDEFDWVQNMEHQLNNKGDFNIITIDWSEGTPSFWSYDQSASNTRSVAAMTVWFAEKLIAQKNISASQIWCIGNSLGAHLCGHFGMGMSSKIGRITGLDPASPSFENIDDLTVGLNPSAALFVDVIHTNFGFIGTLRPLGHVDFYPNGLRKQPGCLFKKRDVDHVKHRNKRGNILSCTHSRALSLFISSITNDCLQATHNCSSHTGIPGSCTGCVDCPTLGYEAEASSARGIFYLKTSWHNPYCL